MGLISAVVTFLVGSLVGGLGIFAGAQLVAGRGDYGHAVWTAVAGALVWTLVGTFLGWIPLVGPVLTWLAYLAVIAWRYRVGLVAAAGIALVAWLSLVGAFVLLGPAGLDVFEAVGVPGV